MVIVKPPTNSQTPHYTVLWRRLLLLKNWH